MMTDSRDDFPSSLWLLLLLLLTMKNPPGIRVETAPERRLRCTHSRRRRSRAATRAANPAEQQQLPKKKKHRPALRPDPQGPAAPRSATTASADPRPLQDIDPPPLDEEEEEVVVRDDDDDDEDYPVPVRADEEEHHPPDEEDDQQSSSSLSPRLPLPQISPLPPGPDPCFLTPQQTACLHTALAFVILKKRYQQQQQQRVQPPQQARGEHSPTDSEDAAWWLPPPPSALSGPSAVTGDQPASAAAWWQQKHVTHLLQCTYQQAQHQVLLMMKKKNHQARGRLPDRRPPAATPATSRTARARKAGSSSVVAAAHPGTSPTTDPPIPSPPWRTLATHVACRLQDWCCSEPLVSSAATHPSTGSTPSPPARTPAQSWAQEHLILAPAKTDLTPRPQDQHAIEEQKEPTMLPDPSASTVTFSLRAQYLTWRAILEAKPGALATLMVPLCLEHLDSVATTAWNGRSTRQRVWDLYLLQLLQQSLQHLLLLTARPTLHPPPPAAASQQQHHHLQRWYHWVDEWVMRHIMATNVLVVDPTTTTAPGTLARHFVASGGSGPALLWQYGWHQVWCTLLNLIHQTSITKGSPPPPL